MFTEFIEALAGNQDIVLTWDIVVALSVFAGSVLYAFNMGPKKIILLILSIYGSLVLLFWFPFFDIITESIEGINTDIIELMLFTVFVFLIYYAFSGSMLKLSIRKPRRGKGPVWLISFLGVSLGGLICAVVFSGGTSFLIGSTSDLIEELFVKDVARFAWMVAPMVVIAASKKSNK